MPQLHYLGWLETIGYWWPLEMTMHTGLSENFCSHGCMIFNSECTRNRLSAAARPPSSIWRWETRVRKWTERKRGKEEEKEEKRCHMSTSLFPLPAMLTDMQKYAHIYILTFSQIFLRLNPQASYGERLRRPSQTFPLDTGPLHSALPFCRATACNATHGIAVAILSVCLSVRLSVRRVYCDKTKWCTADILIPHETAISLVFWHQQRLVRDAPFSVKYSPKVTHPVRNWSYCVTSISYAFCRWRWRITTATRPAKNHWQCWQLHSGLSRRRQSHGLSAIAELLVQMLRRLRHIRSKINCCW